jgi:predicted permease
VSALRESWQRLIGWVRHRQRDADFEDELQAHLQLAADELEAQGLDRAEARRRAAHAVGGLDAARAGQRDARGLPALESVVADVSYAVRRLWKAPMFSLMVIAILAVGIGANTAIFSIVNGVVLRALPLGDADRLVWIAPTTAHEGLSERTYPVRIVEEMQRSASSLDGLSPYFAFFGYANYTLTGRGDAERLIGVPVGPGFFELLGVALAMGRTFTADELRQNGPGAVLLTHASWQRRFGGDPAIVGRAITVSDKSMTVAGVLPASFDFSSIFMPGVQVDMFVPAVYDDMREWGNVFAVVGRLKRGVSIDAARAEFASLMPRVSKELPRWGEQSATLTPLGTYVNGRVERSLMVLWVAVGLVLLVACANLSGLLLARAAGREREFGIRLAIGAGRMRLLRQLLTESAVLALCGAAVGAVLAQLLVSYVKSWPALSVPLLSRVEVDGAALLFAAAIAIASSVLFGLLPALRVASGDPQRVLRDRSRGSTQGRRHAYLRSGLVVFEVALACVLLVGAGLLVRTFINVRAVDLGFAPAQAVAFRVNLPTDLSQPSRRVLVAEIQRRGAALGGIEAAGLTDALPLDRNRTWSAGVPGQVYAPGERPLPYVYVVTEGYFRAMGVRLRSGRDFAASDTSESEEVIVLSESLAQRLWPGQDAVGRLVEAAGSGKRRVIAVAADVRQTSIEAAGAYHMYLPFSQVNDGGLDLVVRSTLPAATVAPMIRRALGDLDPRLTATDARVIGDFVERAISPRRFLVALLSGFAILALGLASLGIYSTVSYGVGERVQEFGVRMALGASGTEIRRGVLAQTLTIVGTGVAIGALASFIVARLMTAMLFETSSTDVATFTLTALVLTAVALTAAYVPAARASRVSPMAALRSE